MFDSTKEKSAQMKDEIVQRAAQGAAVGAEKLAAETKKAAETVRNWADDLERSNRSRGRTYVGVGILAALIAIITYLMTPKGKGHREQLQELGSEVVDRIAS
jgi:hypothetical protein